MCIRDRCDIEHSQIVQKALQIVTCLREYIFVLKYVNRIFCGKIHGYLKNKTKNGTRIRFFNNVTVQVLIYGDEARIMTEKDKAKIQRK